MVEPLPSGCAIRCSGTRAATSYISTSYPDYEELHHRARAFRQLSAYVRLPLNLALGGRTERVSVEAVTVNYFDMLGLPARLGRAFSAQDDRTSGSLPSVMLAEGFWRNRFHPDPNLPGKTSTLEDRAVVVIGVVPRQYRGANLNWGDPPQLWLPLSATPLLIPRLGAADIFHQRNMPWLLMLGRPHPAYTVAEARGEMESIAAVLSKSWHASSANTLLKVFPASQAR